MLIIRALGQLVILLSSENTSTTNENIVNNHTASPAPNANSSNGVDPSTKFTTALEELQDILSKATSCGVTNVKVGWSEFLLFLIFLFVNLLIGLLVVHSFVRPSIHLYFSSSAYPSVTPTVPRPFVLPNTPCFRPLLALSYPPSTPLCSCPLVCPSLHRKSGSSPDHPSSPDVCSLICHKLFSQGMFWQLGKAKMKGFIVPLVAGKCGEKL